MDPLRFFVNLGFDKLTSFQNTVLESNKKAQHLVLHAPTGSGKTLAFLLAALQEMDESADSTQALIISPTRELCLQIEQVWKSLKTGLKVTSCYGGHSVRIEENSLSETPALIIGTPGRLGDHLRRDNINFSNIRLLIIDEYDKVLEMGFEEQLNLILDGLSGHQKNILVSATELKHFPANLKNKNFTTVESEDLTNRGKLKEFLVQSTETSRFEDLFNLLCSMNNEKSLVFCNFRERSEETKEYLRHRGLACEVYHGGLEQDERERALIKFRNGSINTLVCTDLGSRGLDIPEISHVIHFQTAMSSDAYIHRTGRTARMAADGNAFIFQLANEQLPDFIPLPKQKKSIIPAKTIPTPEWITLYFSGGKKDKINKIDLLGFIIQKGNLSKDEIGIISVLDYTSFVAVKNKNVQELLSTLRQFKVKGKKLRMAISK